MLLEIVGNLRCMIPRFPGFYTSMCRSLALPCLIGLGRSRVIPDYSRGIGCFYVSVYELLKSKWNEWKFETGRGTMMRRRYGCRTGLLIVLAPSVSIKYCSVVGCADRGLNCTNRMPGV